jgi:Flp pilus assembly protein TadG
MKLIPLITVPALVLVLAACDAIDTSALQDIQDTAAEAQAAAETINARSAQIQQAVDNPAGALQAALGATLAKTPTDQPGVYVLTDMQTGCQFLGTYGPDGTTVSSIAPRVEAVAGGGTRQRCVSIPGGVRLEAGADGEG